MSPLEDLKEVIESCCEAEVIPSEFESKKELDKLFGQRGFSDALISSGIATQRGERIFLRERHQRKEIASGRAVSVRNSVTQEGCRAADCSCEEKEEPEEEESDPEEDSTFFEWQITEDLDCSKMNNDPCSILNKETLPPYPPQRKYSIPDVIFKRIIYLLIYNILIRNGRANFVEQKDFFSEPVGVKIILKDGTYWEPTKEYVEEMQTSFPGVDIIWELRRMAVWSKQHESKRKTRRGVKKFASSWLGNSKTVKGNNGGQRRNAGTKIPGSGRIIHFVGA